MSAEGSTVESAVEPLNLILVDQDIEPYVLECQREGFESLVVPECCMCLSWP